MARLEIYDGREPHVIDIKVDGKKKEFKIPPDLTVEDVERIFEIEDKINITEKVSDQYALIFEQLYLVFSKHQPDITIAQLKKMLTRKQAVEIIKFIATYTFDQTPKSEEPDSKKKEPKTT